MQYIEDVVLEIKYESIFFWIGNQRFITKKRHHVHDGDHFELKMDTSNSRRDTNRKKKSEMEKLSMNHIFEVKRIMVFCILE